LTQATHFLGVDGGATRCRARLRDSAGRLICEAEGPASNIYVSFDAAMSVVRATVERTVQEAGLDRGRIALGLGLAGISSEPDAARVASGLPGWARVQAANDAVAACLGAHAGADGGLIISGTGSAGIAHVGGVATVVGGRGFLLGDDGAAARVGADAVRAAIRAHDGLEAMSGLSRAILANFQDDPLAMTRWALSAKPSDYGAFAPLVLQAAGAGEPGARHIVDAAARAIGALAAAVRALGAQRIAIVGGLAEPIRPFLPAELSAQLSPPLFDAVDGAILLAGGSLATSGRSA
jgi:glucosamine kinase